MLLSTMKVYDPILFYRCIKFLISPRRIPSQVGWNIENRTQCITECEAKGHAKLDASLTSTPRRFAPIYRVRPSQFIYTRCARIVTHRLYCRVAAAWLESQAAHHGISPDASQVNWLDCTFTRRKLLELNDISLVTSARPRSSSPVMMLIELAVRNMLSADMWMACRDFIGCLLLLACRWWYL